jgi:hypothetical protein
MCRRNVIFSKPFLTIVKKGLVHLRFFETFQLKNYLYEILQEMFVAKIFIFLTAEYTESQNSQNYV